MKPLCVAVFASGSGTNFRAIANAVKQGKLDVEIGLLVCDKPLAPVVEIAKEFGVAVLTFQPKDYSSREAYENEILEHLVEKHIDFIVLAGYMRIITDVMVKAFEGRMINIHPSILPSFAGMRAIQQAMEHGVKVTGVTVHFVDGGLDSGPIIAQESVPILENDSEDELIRRIQKVEHKLYPQVIQWIAEERVEIVGNKVNIRRQNSGKTN